MNSIGNILDMIHTEAVEAEAGAQGPSTTEPETKETLDYRLELVAKPDGSLVWEED